MPYMSSEKKITPVKEFFKGCKYVTRAPACIFLKGDNFTKKAKILPIPLYAYAGIEEGDYRRFEYEEVHVDYIRDYDNRFVRTNFPSCKKRDEKTKAVLDGVSFIESLHRENRYKFYPLYLEEKFKKTVIFSEAIQRIRKERNAQDLETDIFFDRVLTDSDFKKFYKEVALEFKDYFKVKVWTDIPCNMGLNEESAIASAVALVLELKLCENEKILIETIRAIENMKKCFPEEAVIDNNFITGLFSPALSLDFFSNGAGVFASLFGCVNDQKIIDYECLFFDQASVFFKPLLHRLKDKKNTATDITIIQKIPGSGQDYYRAYFDMALHMSKGSFEGHPIFKFGFSKLDSESKEKSVLSVIGKSLVKKYPEEIEKRAFVENGCFDHHAISSFAFVVFGDPTMVALGEGNPGKNLFGVKGETVKPFFTIYNSRRQGWGAKGVEVIDFKESKKFELEIIKNTEGVWYKNLGIEIDCDDRLEHKVFFFVVGEKDKMKIEAMVKSFALLVRLAVAMKTGEKIGEKIGYVHIHTKKEKIEIENCEGCNSEGKCLYFEYTAKDKFRDWLGTQEMFGLNLKDKRNLILLNKGRVRLAVLPENIEIKNIKNIRKLKDKLEPEKEKNPARQKAITSAKMLLDNACNIYEKYPQSNLTIRKV